MSFSISQNAEGTTLVVKVAGNVDEDANFQPIDLGSHLAVTLELEGINAINSVGIREWIKWVKLIPTSVSLTVRKCPKIVVDQINMVSGFLPPNTKVESFYVPYYSEATGSEKMILFTNGKEFKSGTVEYPENVKDDSGELMEIDVIEAKYFKFLKEM